MFQADGGNVFGFDDAVRVMAEKCDTCIFRPGNLMHLAPGRVKGMVEDVCSTGGHITCHDTLTETESLLPPSVCRGMADHPEASVTSSALRHARTQGTFIYTHPVHPAAAAALEDAAAHHGLTMQAVFDHTTVAPTLWQFAVWRITLNQRGNTCHYTQGHGSREQAPQLGAFLHGLAGQVCRVQAARTYEEWAAGFSPRREEWPQEDVYRDEVKNTHDWEDFADEPLRRALVAAYQAGRAGR